MEDIDILLDDFYGKFLNEKLTDEKRSNIKSTYGDDVDTLLKDLYGKFANEDLEDDKISFIKETYGLKKKESSDLSTVVEDTSADSQEGLQESSDFQEDEPRIISRLDRRARANPELAQRYNDFIIPTQEDETKAQEVAQEEQEGDFGVIDKLKRLYSAASLANPNLPTFIHTDPNLDRRIEITKELALERKESTDDIPQNEVDEILKEERIIQELATIKDAKTEEFIETLSEEEQAQLTSSFSADVKSLSSKSKSKLFQINNLELELDSISAQLRTIQEAHDPNNIYANEYHLNNIQLADRGEQALLELEQAIDEIAEIDSDLSTTENELDLFKRNYGTWENFGGKLKIATAELGLNIGFLINKANQGSSVAGGFGIAGGLAIEQQIINAKKGLEEEKDLLRRSKSVDDINSAEDAIEWAMDLVAEQAPNTVLMATTGGASLTILGASAAGGKLFELEQEQREGTANFSEFEKFSSAFLTGIAEAASEKISFGQIKKAKRVFATLGRRELKEGVGKYLKKTITSVGRWEFLKDITTEGISEDMSQLAENMADKFILEKDISLTNGLTDAFVSGVFMSGVIYKMPSIGKHLIQPFVPKDLNQKLGENQAKIESITKQLNNGVNVEAEKALTEQRDALNIENRTLLNKSISGLDKLSSEESTDLLQIESEIFELRKQAKSIREEVKIDDSSKQFTIKTIDEKVSSLLAEKEDILEIALNKPNIENINKVLDGLFDEFDTLSEDDSVEAKDKLQEVSRKIETAVQLRDEVNTEAVKSVPKELVEEATKQFAEKEEGGTQEQINERALELFSEQKSRKKEAEDTGRDATKFSFDTLDKQPLHVLEDKLGDAEIDASREKGANKKRAIGQVQVLKEEIKKAKEDIVTPKINIAKIIKLDKFEDALNNLEKNLDKFSDETLGVGIPVVVAKASIKAMRVALKTANTTADVVSAGMNTIRRSAWFKKLSAEDKGKVEANFVSQANRGFSDVQKIIIKSSQILKDIDKSQKEASEAKRKLKSFKTRVKNRDEAAKQAVAFIKKALSPNEFKKLKKGEFNSLLQQIRDVRTQVGLSKLIDKVIAIVDDAAVRSANSQFKKLLNSKKVEVNKKALLDEFSVDVLKLLTSGKFLNKTFSELDNIEQSTEDEAVLTAVSIARQKRKSDKARRSDMSRVHIEAAVQELDTAIKKGRSNISVLRAVAEAEKKNRIQQARVETSRKTKEEIEIIDEFASIRRADADNNNKLEFARERAIKLTDRISKSYPAMETNDALNELTSAKTKGRVDEVLNSIFKEYTNRADFKSREKRAVSIGRTIVDALTRVSFDIATIVSFISKKGADTMLGGFLHDTITNNIRRSANEFTRIKDEKFTEVNNKIKEVYGKKYSKIFKTIGDLIPTILEDTNAQIDTGEVDTSGDTITLSRGELMWLYNQRKNPSTEVHFKSKGLTPEIMDRLVDTHLTKEDIQFADWLVDEFYPEMYPIINSVYRKLHFRNMPISQFYAGQLQFDIGSSSNTDLTEKDWSLKGTALFFGSGIGRLTHSHPISTHTNAISNLMHYVEESSRFVSSAESYRDITEILNDNEVSKNLAKYTSNRVKANLQSAVEFAFGFKKENTSSGAINFLVHAKIMASLGFTPKLSVTQLMSTTLWMTENPLSIIKNINNVGNIKLLQEIIVNSASMRERYGIKLKNGKVDPISILTGTDMAKLEASYISSRSKAMSRFRGMRLAGKIADTTFKMALSFIKIGDAAGMFVLGVPFYANAKKEGLKKFNGDETKAIKYAVDKFEATAAKTQQSYASQDRDLIQHTGVGKIFNMYANSPKQYFRNSIQALLELSRWTRGKETKGSVPQNFRKFILNHVVQGVLYQWVGSTMLGLLSTDDEDNSKAKDIWVKGALFGSFNKFFILGDIVEGLWDAYQGKRYATNSTLPMLSSVSSIKRELLKLGEANKAEDETAIKKHTLEMAKHMADLLGIPANKSISLVKNLDKVLNESDSMSTEELVARLLNYSDFALGELNDETRKKVKDQQQQSSKDTRERRKKEDTDFRKKKKIIIIR